jgi:hypothetical protein
VAKLTENKNTVACGYPCTRQPTGCRVTGYEDLTLLRVRRTVDAQIGARPLYGGRADYHNLSIFNKPGSSW